MAAAEWITALHNLGQLRSGSCFRTDLAGVILRCHASWCGSTGLDVPVARRTKAKHVTVHIIQRREANISMSHSYTSREINVEEILPSWGSGPRPGRWALGHFTLVYTGVSMFLQHRGRINGLSQEFDGYSRISVSQVAGKKTYPSPISHQVDFARLI